MSTEYAILSALILLISALMLFYYDERLGFFCFLEIRILSEPLYQYGSISGFNPISLFGVAIIFYSIIIVVFKRNAKLNIPIINFYYVFLLLMLFSIINAENYGNFIVYFSKYTVMASMFLISYNILRNNKDVEKSLRYFVTIAIPVMLYGIYQLVTGGGQHAQVHIGVNFDKLMATFAHPNNYAFYLALVILAVLVILQLSFRRRYYYYGILTLAIVSLIFTFSRSTWLSMAFCAVIAMLVVKKARLPIVLLSILVFFVFTPLIMVRFADIIDAMRQGNLSTGSSLGFRLTLAKNLLFKAFPVHPILGFGIGSSMEVAYRYAKWFIPPHDDYLRILIEGGILGLCGYLVFLFGCLVFSIKNIIYFGKNAYFTGLVLMFIFYSGITFGTNTIGSVSVGGMWFCLIGILLKGFELSKAKFERERMV